jgi:hypothetical protein
MSDRALHVVGSIPRAWVQVAPDTPITVRFSLPVDARSAQSGLRLLGEHARAAVRLSDDGTEAMWTPDSPPAEGEHTLLVEDVVSRDHKAVVTPWRLPFVVAASENAVRPYGQVLLHSSTAHLRMSSARYAISKLLDPATGVRRQVAVDEAGNAVDLDAILREDARLFLEKYGKLHPLLYEKIASIPESERIPVALWIHVEEEPVDKSRFDLDPCETVPEPLIAYRAQIQGAQGRVTELLRKRCGVEVQSALMAAPVLFLELTASQAREIARLDDVAGLFLHDTHGVEDLKNSMAISGANLVVEVEGWRGTGVRVAIWEAAPDDDSLLSIHEYFQSGAQPKSAHARLVTGIIKHKVPSSAEVFGQGRRHGGYAPECRIYSANSFDTSALEWAVVHRQCRVVNQSFHQVWEPALPWRSLDDHLKDYLVLHFPFPTVVEAAGDVGETAAHPKLYVAHKGYNTLKVGNHNDAATAIDGGSISGNPYSPHGDRELPEICANGTAVEGVGITQNNTGTSFAAPAVAGSAALLHQIAPHLAWWPEGTRAVLLAGAVNVTGKTWWRDVRAGVDAADGAGALDIAESARIARNHSNRDNAGELRGWDAGTFDLQDFDPVGDWEHFYRVRIPDLGGGRVKVAFAWASDEPDPSTFPLYLEQPDDYDLYVYEGDKLVAWSASWDNTYEIAEFWGDAGKTYTIRIYRAPSDRTAVYARYYGIAWTVRSPAALPFVEYTQNVRDFIQG